MTTTDHRLLDRPEDGPDRAAAGLHVARWAELGAFGGLRVATGPQPVPMAHSVQTGRPLVSIGALGADLIRVAKGTGFAPHTHPGDHLLLVVAGRGTITVGGVVLPTFPGDVYVVPGLEPHAVGAIDDHVIVAVGHPHRPVGSTDRMAPVAYAAVAAALGDLKCLVCDRSAALPTLLHDVGCRHCPCADCANGGLHPS